jgi:hypothetical protein
MLQQIEHVMGAINHATVPAQAAASLVEFLGAQAGPAGIALLQPDEQTVEFITSHGDLLNGPIARWIDAGRAWREWPSARHIGEIQELAAYAPALLTPLRYEERCYGLLWLESHAGHEHTALLAQVLAARLHHLRARQLITSTSDVQKQAVRLTTAASVSQAIINLTCRLCWRTSADGLHALCLQQRASYAD